MHRVLLLAGTLVAIGGLALGTMRVVGHERGELEHRAGPVRLDELRRRDPHGTEQTARLTEVTLERGDRVLVELCAASRAAASAWDGALHAVAWMPESETLLFRTPIGGALGERQRGARRCWTVGIGTVPRTGTVAIEAFWPGAAPRAEVARAALDVRVAAYALPAGPDRAAVALLAIGALLAVLGVANPSPQPLSPSGRGAPDAAGGLGTVLVALGLFAVAQLASGVISGGAVALLLRGVLLSAAQVAIAVTLVGRGGAGGALERLALHRAGRTGTLAALGVAGLAGAVALLVPGLLPPRGVAPLEAAIAWPSGKLAVALVALLVPAAEELFFRGLVLGALRPRLGLAGAVVGSTALFVLAHVPQDLGNPGALLAVGATGLLLGSLRAATGALWPCVLAHLAYNALIVAVAWW